MSGQIHVLLVRIATCAVALSAAAGAKAQSEVFTINGRLKIEGGGMDGAHVVVYKDGAKDRTLTTDLAHFSLDLDLNANYILSFEKDGFVTKKLSFNTQAPAEAIANGFTPFEFAVSLFKQYDDVNMVVFNQPVGMIRYEAEMDDFNYDTDYTKSIQSQLQEVLEQVEKKQEEEKRMEENKEKLKQEEAKANAKAEAEARKAADEKAAAEAKAKKDEEAAAVKAQAERMKQEAAAAKAEQERKQQEARMAETVAKKAAEAKAEEERKAAAEARRQEEERRNTPPPVVRAERPKPPPATPKVEAHEVRANEVQGEDARRQGTVMEGFEESRMRDAATNVDEEPQPEEEATTPEVFRDEELIVEKNQVITVIRLETDNQKNEYRKVVHKFGATFYFKNGEAISRTAYEAEALVDRHD